MPERLRLERIDGQTLGVYCAGDRAVPHGMPSVEEAVRDVAGEPVPGRVTVQAADLGQWGSSLVSYIAGLQAVCRSWTIAFDKDGLPAGVRRLVDLAL